MRSFRVVALAVAISVFGTGCFGSFQLTTKVWQFNKSLENKFVQEVVFLAMVIVPVYGLATLGDALIFNTIEFWTGEKTKIGKAEDGSDVEISKVREGVARVRQLRDGQVVSEFELEQVGASALLVRQGGAVLVSAEALADGAVAVTDASGVRYYSARRMDELRSKGEVGALAAIRAELGQSTAMTAQR